jgi:hypothetical protein
MGFMTGLLRSLATIIGYICGAGIAVAATPKALSLLANYPNHRRKSSSWQYSL